MSKLTPMEKIAILYNGKYDLSKAIYVNTSTKIEIICPVHGSFFKTTKDALTNKAGCQKCAHEERADTKSRFKTKQEVYDFCSDLHNNKFTYIDLIQ